MSAGRLQPFGPGLWLAGGTEVAVAGFAYPTRMAVVRLAGGGLWIWSPVALSEALRREIDALGEVRWLVAPNSLHHLFLAEWRAAYPKAKLYGAPGLRNGPAPSPTPSWTMRRRRPGQAISTRS